jgi:hypothetical protein
MTRREQGWSFHGPQDDLWRIEYGAYGEKLYEAFHL